MEVNNQVKSDDIEKKFITRYPSRRRDLLKNKVDTILFWFY